LLNLVCRLLLEKKKRKNGRRARQCGRRMAQGSSQAGPVESAASAGSAGVQAFQRVDRALKRTSRPAPCVVGLGAALGKRRESGRQAWPRGLYVTNAPARNNDAQRIANRRSRGRLGS